MDEQYPPDDHDGAGIWRDPSGTLALGEPSGAHQIDRDHDRCVTYCLTPGQRRRGQRCPCCYGPVAIRAFSGDEVEPAGTRFAWLAGAFLAGWAHAWREATIGLARR